MRVLQAKTKARAGMAALAALLLLPAQAAVADRLDDVKARGKIVVGVSDSTPPFSFKKDGDGALVGYSLDLVNAVARRLNVAAQFVPLSASERVLQVQQGKI